MNHQNFERILRFRVIPGSMHVGVSAQPHSPSRCGFTTATREWWNLGVDFARSRPPKNRPASNAIATDRLCGCGTCLPAFPLSANEASTEIVQESAVELAALTSVVGGRLNSVSLRKRLSLLLLKGGFSERGSHFLWISNHARGPPEFKHITKGRKRN